MDNEILGMVTQALTENRLNHALDRDEGYQAAKIHESVTLHKLRETLTDQQKELLENFTAAAGETGASAERITYQQGMRDLYVLFMALA